MLEDLVKKITSIGGLGVYVVYIHFIVLRQGDS